MLPPEQPPVQEPIQTYAEPPMEPEEVKEIVPPVSFMMVDPQTEAENLDDDDRNELLDALDDGTEPEEVVVDFRGQGLEISLEAVQFLQRDLGREAANLTDEKVDEINE